MAKLNLADAIMNVLQISKESGHTFDENFKIEVLINNPNNLMENKIDNTYIEVVLEGEKNNSIEVIPDENKLKVKAISFELL